MAHKVAVVKQSKRVKELQESIAKQQAELAKAQSDPAAVVLTESNAYGYHMYLNRWVVVIMASYIYYGYLIAVNTNTIAITNAKIVYSTGDWKKDTESWGSAEAPTKAENTMLLNIGAIESLFPPMFAASTKPPAVGATPIVA